MFRAPPTGTASDAHRAEERRVSELVGSGSLRRSRVASAVRNHAVDDPVRQGLLGAHVVVALEVARDLRERLAGVLGDDLLERPPEREHLTRLDLDVARLSLETAGDLVEQDL